MWKLLILLSVFKSNPLAFRLGEIECDAYPEAQPNARVECDGLKCSIECNEGFKFPDGETKLSMACLNRERWIVNSYGNLPECAATCSPACLNGGSCISPDKCACQPDFTGHRCQTRLKPCSSQVPLPQNTMGKCIRSFTGAVQTCKVTCIEGFQFPDGSITVDIRCKNGDWVIEPEYFAKCEPVCDQPCLNGAQCLGPNFCQCSDNFRGDQCQYNAKKVCSPKKMNFNGGYNCTGNMSAMTCQLYCPSGFNFEHPSNSLFTCKYSDGFYQPENVPKCDYKGYQVQISEA